MSMVELNREVVKRVVGGIDWGFTNAGVLQVWAIDGDGRAYMVHEIYRTGMLIDWWIEQAKIVRAHFKVEVFYADPSEPAYIKAMRRAGLNVEAAENDVAPGIQTVQKRLQTAQDGRARLYILRSARTSQDESLRGRRLPTCTAEEFPEYTWAVRPGSGGGQMKEEPVKQNDHGLDTLRYVIYRLDMARSRKVYTW